MSPRTAINFKDFQPEGNLRKESFSFEEQSEDDGARAFGFDRPAS
jgi:hypothetical protein